MPTLPLAVHVLLSVMRHFGWAHVPIVSSHQDIWLATARQVAMTQDTRTACGAGGLSGTRGAGGHGEQEATEVPKQLCSVDGLKSKCMWVPSSYPSPDFTWLVMGSFLVSDSRLSP